jgi:hypothetical protein
MSRGQAFRLMLSMMTLSNHVFTHVFLLQLPTRLFRFGNKLSFCLFDKVQMVSLDITNDQI